MTIQYVNTGTSANAGNGDSIRLAFSKVNNNFSYVTQQIAYIETYASANPVLENLTVQGISQLQSPVWIASTSTLYNTQTSYLDNIILELDSDIDDYSQLSIQNWNNGVNASADLILYNDASENQINNYVNLGINSSNYVQAGYDIQTPGSGYLYTSDGDLIIGTQRTGTNLVFHAGGTSLENSAGRLDQFGWTFNRQVVVSVSKDGPLVFSSQNTSDGAGAQSVYQGENDNNSYFQLGINGTNKTSGNILGSEVFLIASGSGQTMHIGSQPALNLYADYHDSNSGDPALRLDNYSQSATFRGDLLPLADNAQDIGSTSTQWRDIYIAGSINANAGSIRAINNTDFSIETFSTDILLPIIDPGTGYDASTDIFQTSGGNGLGLTVRYTAVDGAVVVVNIESPGNGLYNDGDVLTVLAGNNDCTVTLNLTGKQAWIFGADGTLVFPDGSVQSTAHTIAVSDLPPTDNINTGTLWYNNVDGHLYINYSDNWIDTNPQPAVVATTSTAGVVIPDGVTISVDSSGTISVISSPSNGFATTSTLVNNGYVVTLESDGILTLPNGNGQIGTLEAPYTGLEFRTGSGADWIGISYGEINDLNTSYFYFDKDGSDYLTANHQAHLQIKNPTHDGHLEWLFDSNGTLTLPAGGAFTSPDYNFSFNGTGEDGVPALGTVVTSEGGNDIGEIFMGSGYGEFRSIYNSDNIEQTSSGLVYAGVEGFNYVQNGDVNFAGMVSQTPHIDSMYTIGVNTLSQITIGFTQNDQTQQSMDWSVAVGSLTTDYTVNGLFADTSETIISGKHGIKLNTDRGTVLFGNQPECVPTLLRHFHIMREDPENVDLFLGDDLNYVKLPGSGETTYGVEIGTYDLSTGTSVQQVWRFGTDGQLTLPVGGGIVDSNGDSVLGGGGASTGNIGFVTDYIYDFNGITLENADLTHGATAAVIVPANGNSTNPIHLNNLYGGVRVTSGITGATQSWDFNSDGELILPQSGAAALITAVSGGSIQIQPKPGSIETSPNGGDLLLYAGAADTEHNAAGGNVHILSTAKNGAGSGIVHGIVDITTPGGTWTFNENGDLTLPTGGEIKTEAGTGDVVVEANNGTARTWTFGGDGGLTFPDTSVQTEAWNDTNFMTAMLGYDGEIITNTATIGVGGLVVNGPVTFNGPFTYQTTATTAVTGNTGTFYGDVNGVGALYAGVAGYSPLPSTVFQSAANVNAYIQNNFQNLHHGNQASTEWVATNDTGDDTNNYIDIGIAGHGWDGTQANSVGTAAGPSDSWVYAQGTVSTSEGGNLILGTIKNGKAVKILAGSTGSSSVVATFNGTGLTINTGTIRFADNTVQSTAATSFNTSTLVAQAVSAQSVVGGIGVASITAGTGTVVSGSTGAVTIWTTPTAWTGGTVSGTATVATFIGTASATSTSTGAVQVQGGLGVSGNLYANTVYSGDGYFRGPAGTGSILLSSGGVVYLSSDLVLNGASSTIRGPAGYSVMTIGSPSGAGNSGVKFIGTATVAGTTPSTSTTTGALLVTGGVGIGGSAYVNGYVVQQALPAFRVIGNGGSVSTGTTITNAHWTMDYNQGNYLNTSTGVFTAPVTGIYQINLVMRTNNNVNSTINQAIVIKNTSTALCMLEFGVNTTMNHAGVSTAARLTAGDTVKVTVAVGTMSFDSNDNWSIAFLG